MSAAFILDADGVTHSGTIATALGGQQGMIKPRFDQLIRMLEQLQRRWEEDGGWSWAAEGTDEAQ